MYSKQVLDCIYNCSNCHNICLQTMRHCLKKGGNYSKTANIIMLLDCAEICATNANFMLRMSGNLHEDTCALCAQVCSMCAVECESIADGDQQVLACMEACRQCAEACEFVAAETI